MKSGNSLKLSDARENRDPASAVGCRVLHHIQDQPERRCTDIGWTVDIIHKCSKQSRSYDTNFDSAMWYANTLVGTFHVPRKRFFDRQPSVFWIDLHSFQSSITIKYFEYTGTSCDPAGYRKSEDNSHSKTVDITLLDKIRLSWSTTQCSLNRQLLNALIYKKNKIVEALNVYTDCCIINSRPDITARKWRSVGYRLCINT